MSASSSALQLGLLPWRLKWRQESVWSGIPTEIEEMDNFLGEVEQALSALADKITPLQRSLLSELLKRMEECHRRIADQNLDHYTDLIDAADTRQPLHRYREYLADEANLILRECQRRDQAELREQLAATVKGDKRLQGYFAIGDCLGAAVGFVKRDSGPLSETERARVLAGMKKLPLREQREIERLFFQPGLGLLALGLQIKKLSRFLERHEDDLVAKPTWDGRTLTYRGKSEPLKVQKGLSKKSVIARILDRAEADGWPDSFKLPIDLAIAKKKTSNAIDYFHRHHKVIEFSVNGDRMAWGPLGTVKR